MGARGLSRIRLQEQRAQSAGIAIVYSLCFVLIAAALLVGGQAVIGPMLRNAIAAREAKGTGDVVYTMPDGVFCRHMSFDNITAEVTEGAIERCPEGPARGPSSGAAARFSWGAH